MANPFSGTPLPTRFDKPVKQDTSDIFKIGEMEERRDNEMRRRFEVERAITLEQLDTIAGYELSKLNGQLGQEFQRRVNLLLPKVAEGGDLTALGAEIAALTQTYKQFDGVYAEGEGKAARDLQAKIAAGDAAAINAANMNLPAGNRVTAANMADLDSGAGNFFVEGTYNPETGMGVDRFNPSGGMVRIEETTLFANPARAYELQTESAPIQTARERAQGEAVQARIRTEGGNVFTEKAAINEFEGLDDVGTADGRDFRAAMIDSLIETGQKPFDTQEEIDDFVNGVNLDSHKNKVAQNMIRDEFVRLAKFRFDKMDQARLDAIDRSGRGSTQPDIKEITVQSITGEDGSQVARRVSFDQGAVGLLDPNTGSLVQVRQFEISGDGQEVMVTFADPDGVVETIGVSINDPLVSAIENSLQERYGDQFAKVGLDGFLDDSFVQDAAFTTIGQDRENELAPQSTSQSSPLMLEDGRLIGGAVTNPDLEE
jgi:hypothetical protein